MDYQDYSNSRKALGAPDPGNPNLIARIRSRIREKGRITFAEFMSMVLYDPDHGYYTSEREIIGTSGDFLTSPAMHPAFGAMVARWLAARWHEMGSPDPFCVVEMGAGKGLLAAGILAYMRESIPDIYTALRYLIIEKGRKWTADERLSAVAEDKIEVFDSLAHIDADSIVGCFISNELIDAFPVHQVTVEGGRLRELYVTAEDGKFVEETGDPSTPEIPAYFERLCIVLPDGYRTEVNLRAPDWMREVGSKLHGGYVLTIDYGYTAEEYYSPKRRRGTLLCYYRHTYSEDPYVRVGLQDITAHVDFTSLINAGREAGLEPVKLTTQREFLLEQGIQERFKGRAVMSLLDPQGMGGFKVLVQRRVID